jgi:hypothetical protein
VIFFVKLPPTRNHASNSRSRYGENQVSRQLKLAE